MKSYDITIKANGKTAVLPGFFGITCGLDVIQFAAKVFGDNVQFTASAPAIGMFQTLTSKAYNAQNSN